MAIDYVFSNSYRTFRSSIDISSTFILSFIPSTDELAGMDYHMLSQPFSYMKLKKKFMPAKCEHDFIIIDTGPAYNLFSVNAWNFSDSILMLFIPGPATEADIAMVIRNFQDFDVDIQVVFNQVARNISLANQAHHELVFRRHPDSRPAIALNQLTSLTAASRQEIANGG